MSEFFCLVAEQAGLDPTDEAIIERISTVLGGITATEPVNVFDEAVDALLGSRCAA